MTSTKFVQTMELFLQNSHLFSSTDNVQKNELSQEPNFLLKNPAPSPKGTGPVGKSAGPVPLGEGVAEKFNRALNTPIKQKKFYTSHSKISELRYISVGFASSQTVRRWAEKTLPNGKVLGEVTSANTLHHKTFKPLKGGLFCERIFGPLKDFECACGIRKRPSQEEYQKIIEHRETNRQFCPTCDVEYTWSIIRRYQMGYIQLVSPVTHIWYLKANPSYLSILLDIKRTQLENVVYCSETLTLENSAKVVQNFSLSTSPSDLFLSWQELLKSESQLNDSNAYVLFSANFVKRKLEEEKRSLAKVTKITNDSKILFLDKKAQKPQNSSFARLNSTQSIQSLLSWQIQQDWEWFYRLVYSRAQDKTAQIIKRFLAQLRYPHETEIINKSCLIDVLVTPNFSRSFVHRLNLDLKGDSRNPPSVKETSYKFFLTVGEKMSTPSTTFWGIFNDLQKFELETWTLTNDVYLLLQLLTKAQTENNLSDLSVSLTQGKLKTVKSRTVLQRILTSTPNRQVKFALIQAIQLAFHRILTSSMKKESIVLKKSPMNDLDSESLTKIRKFAEMLSNQLSLSLLKNQFQKHLVHSQFIPVTQNLQEKWVSLSMEQKTEDFIDFFKEQQKFAVLLGYNQKLNNPTQTALYQTYLLRAGDATSGKLNVSNVHENLQNTDHWTTLFEQKSPLLKSRKGLTSTFIHKQHSSEFSSTAQRGRKFSKNIFHWNHGYLFSTLPVEDFAKKGPSQHKPTTVNSLKIDHLRRTYRGNLTRFSNYQDSAAQTVQPRFAGSSVLQDSTVAEITICKQSVLPDFDGKSVSLCEKRETDLNNKDMFSSPINKQSGSSLSLLAQQQRKHRSLYSYLSFFKKKRKTAKNHLYSVSYRESWTHEKNWQYFSYYSLAPRYFEDVSIPIYQLRGLSNGENAVAQSSLTGAGLLKTLLLEFHPKELRKMDKQNRVFLYEFSKKIQTLKTFAKKGFAEKSEIKELKELCKKRDQFIRKTKLIRKLFLKNSNPTSMILSTLPVLPPDLRPILKMQDQIAASDLNRLYQRVIYRNDRLKKFRKDLSLSYGSHSFELKYAQRLLQEAVDNLIQNGKGGVTPERDSRGRALKSLSEILKGKQGRFRQYLLGKRVDYSGRSVIVVGPKLKIHQCGLPREIAVELFLPFLIKRILHSNFARTVIGAKTLIKTNANLTSFLLAELMQNHPILLNRAPTLHRLGFQAFQPKLVDGRAILLHPLVCPAFNADFDGDQMAVHVPLTVEARAEAWKLMFSRNHLISAATGDPIMLPSQDMVLGCYYLTTDVLKYQKELGSLGEIALAPGIQISSIDQSRIGMNAQQNYESEIKQLFSTYLFTRSEHRKKNETFTFGEESRVLNKQYFNNFAQVINAYDRQQLSIHSDIWVKWTNPVENISGKSGTLQTEPLELRIASDGSWQELRLKEFRRFVPQGTTPPSIDAHFSKGEGTGNFIVSVDRTKNLLSQYIRTTPGRVLFYNFIQNELKK